MVDSQYGLAVGEDHWYNGTFGAYGTIWETWDGGFTWNIVYKNPASYYHGYYGIAFLNRGYGLVAGLGDVVKFTNIFPFISKVFYLDTVHYPVPFTATFEVSDADKVAVTVSGPFPLTVKLESANSYKISGEVPESLVGKDFNFSIKVEDIRGGVTNYTSTSIHVDRLVHVEDNGIPTEYSLSQNYPNPFNPSTTISYSVPTSCQVRLTVLDILGREIVTLVDEQKFAGTYEVNFTASNLPSGIYFYRLTAGTFTNTKKMTLVK
ncbi:MAG: T9SS type A sorting domain-containing protein [Ignavibacteriales bacterium]|nr:T9SS type A sorting domain-containing protein [Ignavibacteriales bacterium]